MNRSILKTGVFSFLILLFSICLIIFPKQSLDASVSGLHIWLEVVFPSLFPFFICAELFTRYGIAHFIGYLFEPIMRPLFNIPGIGSMALLIGMISGYPSGAKISAQLRKEKLLTRNEAERLLAFTNNASPLFIFGVIAIGFYGNEQIGFIILFIHYMSNLCVGFSMRFYQNNKNETKPTGRFQPVEAVRKMHRVRIQNAQPLGEQLSEIITQSAQTLCIIGGYIILFSVLTTMLELLSFQTIMTAVLHPIFDLFNISSNIIPPLITGLLEITLGTKQFATSSNLSFSTEIIGVCLLLGFNGLSVHAQVASIISTTDLRYLPYFIGRIIHSLFSILLAVLCLPYFTHSPTNTSETIETSLLLYETYAQHFLAITSLLSILMLTFACFMYIKKHLNNI